MTVWFTGDTHFNHLKIAQLRAERMQLDAFSAGDETVPHDIELIKRWNAVVAPDDVVWHLGDVGVGDPTHFVPLMASLNGRKRLVYGNHDRPWPGHTNAQSHVKYWSEWFEYMTPFAKINLNGHKVLLSHFPYKGDHTVEERYSEYRLHDDGKWLIHAHVHDAWKVHGRQINVGVDQWNYRPVSEGDLAHLIQDSENEWMRIGYDVVMGELDWESRLA